MRSFGVALFSETESQISAGGPAAQRPFQLRASCAATVHQTAGRRRGAWLFYRGAWWFYRAEVSGQWLGKGALTEPRPRPWCGYFSNPPSLVT